MWPICWGIWKICARETQAPEHWRVKWVQNCGAIDHRSLREQWGSIPSKRKKFLLCSNWLFSSPKLLNARSQLPLALQRRPKPNGSTTANAYAKGCQRLNGSFQEKEGYNCTLTWIITSTTSFQHRSGPCVCSPAGKHQSVFGGSLAGRLQT